jgi:hypothetical protein
LGTKASQAELDKTNTAVSTLSDTLKGIDIYLKLNYSFENLIFEKIIDRNQFHFGIESHPSRPGQHEGRRFNIE